MLCYLLLCAETGTFSFSLHMKPVHSNTCLPFSSHVPASRKRALLLGENWRTIRNSSSSKVRQSKFNLRRRFIANCYPKKWVNDLYDKMPMRHRDEDEEKPITYMKLPYIDEVSKRQVMRLRRKCQLDNRIRIIFQTAKPLSHRWRKKKERPRCDQSCWTCNLTRRKQRCYTKHVVYEISCILCDEKYIGQTDRTVRSRLKEHVQSQESAVFQHATIVHQTLPEDSITWKIIDVERNTSLRLSLEAIYIQNNQSSLMNNCVGEALLSFL